MGGGYGSNLSLGRTTWCAHDGAIKAGDGQGMETINNTIVNLVANQSYSLVVWQSRLSIVNLVAT